MGPTWENHPYRTPPPPTIKDRTVGGVQNFLSVIDLSTTRSTVDLCTLFNLHIGPPPPPPPTIKDRTVGGVWNFLSTVDLSAIRSTVDLCALFNFRANQNAQLKLRIVLFCGFFALLPLHFVTMGLGNTLQTSKS
jgi:hypothetical protein